MAAAGDPGRSARGLGRAVCAGGVFAARSGPPGPRYPQAGDYPGIDGHFPGILGPCAVVAEPAKVARHLMLPRPCGSQLQPVDCWILAIFVQSAGMRTMTTYMAKPGEVEQ